MRLRYWDAGALYCPIHGVIAFPGRCVKRLRSVSALAPPAAPAPTAAERQANDRSVVDRRRPIIDGRVGRPLRVDRRRSLIRRWSRRIGRRRRGVSGRRRCPWCAERGARAIAQETAFRAVAAAGQEKAGGHRGDKRDTGHFGFFPILRMSTSGTPKVSPERPDESSDHGLIRGNAD